MCIFCPQPLLCTDICIAWQYSVTGEGAAITSIIMLKVEGIRGLDWSALAETTPQAGGAPLPDL